MARLSDEQLEQITSSVDIVDIIDQFVALKKRGKNHFGYCPFHDERTPSFSVSQEKQLFKCFSCGRAGNVFSFFMEKDGLTFIQAVKKVVDLANLPIQIDDDSNAKPKSKEQLEKEQLIACHELALEFYHHVLLNTTEGEEALEYLLQRGLTMDTIQTFKIGVSPSSRDLLVKLLLSKGYTTELLEKTGLVSTFESGILDRFTQRIMVPLRNENGECVAFSGRIYKKGNTPDDHYNEPKYLNSPETTIFHKGQFLFNLDLARGSIRKNSDVVLCEGYMDVIAIYQTGIHHVVASMGTSLTTQQLGVLQRLSRRLTFAYDGDSAGQKATQRAIELSRELNHFDITVVPMKDNLDPDEMIQRYGATYFTHHLAQERETVFNFYQRYYRQEYELDNQKGRLDYIDALLNQLVYEPSLTARAMAIGQLSDEFHIDTKALEQQFDTFVKKRPNRVQKGLLNEFNRNNQFEQVKPPVVLSELEWIERRLLKRILQDQQTLDWIKMIEPEFMFETELYAEVFFNYQGYLYEHSDDMTQFVNHLTDLSQQQLTTDLLLEMDQSLVTRLEIEQVLHKRAQLLKQKELNRIQSEIQEATKAGDSAEVERLLLAYQSVYRQLK